MYKKTLLIFILITFLLSGCSKRPKDILSEDKMVAVMTDIQIAEAYERNGDAHEYLNGRDRELIGRGVLMKHGVTVEEMDSTLAWYGRNMDEYSKLYKKIDAELNKRQLKYARAAGESENEGSLADLWPYSRHFVLDQRSLTDGITANIPVTEIALGDKLTWKMVVDGASSRNLTLGVDYENGTSDIYHISNKGFDKWVELSLQTDSTLAVNRIFAIADFNNSTNRVLIDSIQLTHTPLNHEEYHKSGFQRSIRPAGRKIILPPDTSANSSSVPEAILSKPSLSTEKSLGVSTRR
ncbi:MAG: DUF4296 domain-containing protein [Muribaculaceae bacterium]|nr:DUF4296 domain-containing protein [Muribaculaceae bacterium]